MNLFRSFGVFVASVALAAVPVACGGGDERSDTLADLADQIAVPAYGDLADSTAELTQAVTALCDTPSVETLAVAHDALGEARYAWSATEAMWLGPVMDARSWAAIDWPIATAEIEELISDEDSALDVESLATRIGADQRGLGAVEYVLGTPGQSAALEELTDPRRCQYLVGVATVVSDEAQDLEQAWATEADGGEPFAETMAQADAGTLDMLVNDSLFLLEAIGDAELGRALGLLDAEPDASNIVEGPAGLGVDDIAAHLVGLRHVLVGDGANSGVAPLFDDGLAQRLRDQFDAADAAVAAIDGPLLVAIDTEGNTVSALRDAVKDIQMTVATEVVSALGVTVGFSDADGDTGG